MNKNVMDLIADEKIYPIVRSKNAQNAIDIAHALIEGGIKVMEIVVENPSLFSAIDEISKERRQRKRFRKHMSSLLTTKMWQLKLLSNTDYQL